MVPGNAYMVKLSGPNSLVVSGTPVDALGSPIDVTPGWNWIGYHPQGSQSVDEALGSLRFRAPRISSRVSTASPSGMVQTG